MNEYPGEVNYTLEKYKLRPVEYLESLGILQENFVAAHGILLSPGEKRLLEKRNVKVVHCPFSNCGKGVPETPDLVERGISIGLGTDGTAPVSYTHLYRNSGFYRNHGDCILADL